MSREDRGPEHWDDRYAARADRAHDHSHTDPAAELVELVRDLPAGRALDLGCGRGRHAIWLAGEGWQVTAVDFSAVGIDQARMRSTAQGVDVEWVVADARTWTPEEGAAFDLVLLAYMHLEAEAMGRVTDWLAPGGRLLVLGHALRNLTEGAAHGPKDPSILHTPESLRDKATGLIVERCEEVLRHHAEGDSYDVVLSARRAP